MAHAHRGTEAGIPLASLEHTERTRILRPPFSVSSRANSLHIWRPASGGKMGCCVLCQPGVPGSVVFVLPSTRSAGLDVGPGLAGYFRCLSLSDEHYPCSIPFSGSPGLGAGLDAGRKISAPDSPCLLLCVAV